MLSYKKCGKIFFSAIMISWLLGGSGYASSQDSDRENFADYYNIDKESLGTLPFYRYMVTDGINTGNSFMVVGKKGSGKTSLWHWLKRNEKSTDELGRKILIVEPFSDKTFLENALRAFIENQPDVLGESDPAITISKKWSQTDMVDFVFSRVACEVLDKLTNGSQPVSKNDTLNENQKKALFVLTCFYFSDYSDSDNNLARFVSLAKLLGLVGETESDSWDREYSSKIDDSDSLYKKLSILSNKKITVFNKEKNKDKLKLLGYISQQANIDPLEYLGKYTGFNKAVLFEEYLILLRQIGFSIKIAVDGLEEVEALGVTANADSSYTASAAFSAVVGSLEPLVGIGVGYNQDIKLFLFLPLCDNNELYASFLRRYGDKLIVELLDWSKTRQIGYGNFLLDHLKSKQKHLSCGWFFCNKLPDTFADLLGGPDCETEFLKNVKNPREFNELFSNFIAALGASNEFIGDSECRLVKTAKNGFPNKNINENTNDARGKIDL